MPARIVVSGVTSVDPDASAIAIAMRATSDQL